MKRKIIKKRTIAYAIITCVIATALAGCGGGNAESKKDTLGADVSKQTATQNKNDGDQDYSEYIHNAMQSVTKDAVTPAPEKEDDLGQVVVVPDMDGDSLYVSASEQLPEDSGITPVFGDELTEAENSEEDESTDEDETAEGAESEEPEELTPDEFEVGTSCIYIRGEIDAAYGSDIISEINKARVELGYKELKEKKGLDTCADRRTREVAAHLGHMRPNATPFYSLAPQYFKAEMLAIDGANAADTVLAWIRDPVSRSLIFTNKYSSIGAACLKTNDLNCAVVAFGY